MKIKRPYLGRNRKEIRDQILAKQVQIKKNEIPDGWSMEAADFINRMIQRKPNNRLGVNGPEEVKSHPWLKDFPFEKLMNRDLEPPFIPNVFIYNLKESFLLYRLMKIILTLKLKTLKEEENLIILKSCNKTLCF